MLSAERVLRRGAPIDLGDGADPAEDVEVDDREVFKGDPSDEDGRDEDEYFVFGLNCPRVAMFLTRRTDRAAPQSMKAKVAPFHNFILERGGALKLCGERKRRTCSNSHQSRKPPSRHVTPKAERTKV